MSRSQQRRKSAPSSPKLYTVVNPSTGRPRAAGAFFDLEDARQAARQRAERSRNPQQVYILDFAKQLGRPVGPMINPGQLEVTDRAYRYRANAAVAAGEKYCRWCGADGKKTRLDVAHINGKEEDNRKQNLTLSCRPCNVHMGRALARAGQGRKTRQYNPEGASSLAQYTRLLLIMRGQIDGDGTSPAEAAAAIAATPAGKRHEYAKSLWAKRKKKYGPSGRYQEEIPF